VGQPAEYAHGVLQQVSVGGMVDVGGDDGGVDAQLAAAQQLAGRQLGQQRGVELAEHLWAGAADELAQRGRVWDGLIQGDAAEPPPGDRVGNLAAQRLVAELVAVLQVQQAQQGGDRDRRAAQPPVKQRPPRGDEPLVVQVGVDPGELNGQASGLRRQQHLPGGWRRGGNTKHHKPPEHSEGASSSFCHDATAIQEHPPCSEAIPLLSSSSGSS
jgi:hypothetical protein